MNKLIKKVQLELIVLLFLFTVNYILDNGTTYFLKRFFESIIVISILSLVLPLVLGFIFYLPFSFFNKNITYSGITKRVCQVLIILVILGSIGKYALN